MKQFKKMDSSFFAPWDLFSSSTNSRDEASWLIACTVCNVNLKHTAPAPAFSVERESVSDSVSEWVSQGPCRHFQHLTELAPSDVPMKSLNSSIVTFLLFFTKSLTPIYCRTIIFTYGGTFAFQNNPPIIQRQSQSHTNMIWLISTGLRKKSTEMLYCGRALQPPLFEWTISSF